MSDTTPIERPVRLKSLLNGEVITPPPEWTPELIDEVVRLNAFERIDDTPPAKVKQKGSPHGQD